MPSTGRAGSLARLARKTLVALVWAVGGLAVITTGFWLYFLTEFNTNCAAGRDLPGHDVNDCGDLISVLVALAYLVAVLMAPLTLLLVARALRRRRNPRGG